MINSDAFSYFKCEAKSAGRISHSVTGNTFAVPFCRRNVCTNNDEWFVVGFVGGLYWAGINS